MEIDDSDFSMSWLSPGMGLGNSESDKADNFLTKLENTESSFQFTCISNSEFNAIYKKVKRERQRKREAQKWESFLQKQQEKERKESNKDFKKEAKRDASTITVDVSARQDDPVIYKEPKIPQLIQAPVTTLVNETTIGEGIPPEAEPKEAFIDVNTGSKVKQEIIQFVHASSDGLEDDTLFNFEKEIKKTNKLGRKLDRKHAMKKIDGLQTKIITSLNGIEELLSKDPFEDVSKCGIDIIKNQKRNIAFAARFKRNYHYHLVCQINEIQKLMKNKTISKTKPNVIIEKLLSSHQVIFQALQVIEKHFIGTFLIDEAFSWLREFMDSICELSSLLSTHERVLDKYNDVRIACDELAATVDDFCIRMTEVKMYEKFINQPSKKDKSAAKQQDNLWMYRNRFSCNKKIRLNKNSIKA
ncbi:uncharacterized protein LOC106661551 [Cimex lectularius]|uniref:Uncharacterized protein n=1 Tax=Cimex lectularius TaxID=79782 RepID=A0A8I6RDN9_CIMLE|nr:uncharacterized protein LOC106661551 [Cimex lectularius]